MLHNINQKLDFTFIIKKKIFLYTQCPNVNKLT